MKRTCLRMIMCGALACGLTVGCGSMGGGGDVSSQRLRVVNNPTIAEMDRIEKELGIHPSQQPEPPSPPSPSMGGASMMPPPLPPSPLVGPETEVGRAGTGSSVPLTLPEPMMPEPVGIEPSGGGPALPVVPDSPLGTGATLPGNPLPGNPLPGVDPLEGLTSDGL